MSLKIPAIQFLKMLDAWKKNYNPSKNNSLIQPKISQADFKTKSRDLKRENKFLKKEY